jgi:Lrp/AsnC family leucine-responsive transcriptional regulator
MAIDTIDREILGHLQTDGRMSYKELGENVGLSPTAVAARMDRMVQSGVIAGFRAQVDHRALGNMIHALVDIRFNQTTYGDDFIPLLESKPEVVAVRFVTGPFDCALDVWVPSPEHLDRLLADLKQTRDVAEMQTRLVLRTAKG